MRKTRILAIAPYEGLSIQISNAARERKDLEVVCHTGDLEEGLLIADRVMDSSYDVIISRGGTASLLQENGYSVIDIPISLYDLLRSIRQATGARKKYAVVGFEAITKNASFLQDVLEPDTRIDIYTIHTADEADEVMNSLKTHGIEIVVCDQISATAASRHRLNYILINSGRESINAALDNAVLIGKEKAKRKDAETICRRLASSGPDPILVMEDDRILNEDAMMGLSSGLMTIIKARAAKLQCGETSYMEYDDGEMLYSVDMKKSRIGEKDFSFSYLRQTRLPFSLESNGIVLRNSAWARDRYLDSFYGCTNAGSKEIDAVESFARRRYPVFIFGERGTGKGNLAQLLYSLSLAKDNPLFDVDMHIAGEKAIEFIRDIYTKNPDKKAVFHFKNLDKGGENVVKELIDLNEEFALSRRAFLIATATVDDRYGLPPYCQDYIERLQCLTLKTRNLREHRKDISSVTNLYISNLNRNNGTDMISIEDEGMRLLEEFDWPGNNDQLARVLKKLNAQCTDQIIKVSSIRQALEDEERLMQSERCPAPGIDLKGKTLKELEKEIVHSVLEEEHGNRSSTARRLGLSRATLWRMLQDEES